MQNITPGKAKLVDLFSNPFIFHTTECIPLCTITMITWKILRISVLKQLQRKNMLDKYRKVSFRSFLEVSESISAHDTPKFPLFIPAGRTKIFVFQKKKKKMEQLSNSNTIVCIIKSWIKSRNFRKDWA